MKKILIGICGIGNGHINRQLNVIKELLKRKFHIVLATTINNKDYLEKKFPKLEKIYINIPWITCNSYGIDFNDCLEKYRKNGIDYYESFLIFSNKVEKTFKSKPDIIITDYEPNVAQYAYATGTPLICMEQQSKFLYLKEEKIDNYSIKEETYRLNYFFPKYDCKLISSFFDLDIKKEKNIYILPPIINKIKRGKIIENKGVVYFSPYCNDKNKFIKILNMMKNVENINFSIYTNINFSEYEGIKNLNFKHFSNNFKKDFSNAAFIISSSGHQLISEAISCNIPLFLFTLDTYEQNYNCLMVEKYHLGKKIINATSNEFYDFYNSIPNYIEKIKLYKLNNWKSPWNEIFMVMINKLLNDRSIKK